MQDFRRLQVWNKALMITTRIYEVTKCFPSSEQFGLTAQLRSASCSIGANIAEGCGRGSNRDFLRFLHIAIGSAFEVENHILVAERLGYLDEYLASSLVGMVVEQKRMLASLMREVKKGITTKKEGCKPS
jgi:four helix bundle protein